MTAPAVRRGRAGRAPSVARSLDRAFALVILLVLAVAGSGALGLSLTGAARDREVSLDELGDADAAMLLAVSDAGAGVRAYQLTQNPDLLDSYARGRAALPLAAARALAAADDDGQRALVRRQQRLARRWFTAVGEPVTAMAPGSVLVTEQTSRTSVQLQRSFRSANTALADRVAVHLADAREQELQVRRVAGVLTGASLAAALATALVTGRRARRGLVEPMADLVAVLSRLTAGDHDARAVLHRGPAEARALAASVNALADESDRLREAERDAAALQECAVQIGRSIREHLQPAGSVAEAVALLGAALDVDEVYVRTLDGGHLSGVQSRWTRPGSGAPDAQWQSSADPDALRELYAAGDVLHLPDLTRGPIAPALVELVRHTGATAALAVPIGAGERASGMLTLLVRSGPRTWTAAEVSLTRSVATDLGRAVLLGGLFAESEHLVAELQDLDRMKSQFLSTVSHELRTPLTSIAGYVEMVRDGDAGPLPEAAGAMLEVVQRNIRRLNVLIEDLLTLSRIETGAFRVSRSEVCVDDVVADVLRSARPAAEAAGIWLDAAPGPAGLFVEGDAEQLVRMLGQLVSNGVKFSAPGSTVVLTTALDGGRVELVVTDRGIGVPAEELPRLFQRFYRASNAREREVQGLGLGLVIARSVAEHHGGELLLESALGSGTTARVRLPLRQDAAAAAPPTASAGDGPGARAR